MCDRFMTIGIKNDQHIPRTMVIRVFEAHVSMPKCGHMQIGRDFLHIYAPVYSTCWSVRNLIVRRAIARMLFLDAFRL